MIGFPAMTLAWALVFVPMAPQRIVSGPSVEEMTALVGLTAVFDMVTTLRGVAAGQSEANPLMRPFVEAGPIPTILAVGALTGLQAVLSNELKQRGYSWWWVPQAGTAVLHVVAGMRNLSKNEPQYVSITISLPN